MGCQIAFLFFVYMATINRVIILACYMTSMFAMGFGPVKEKLKEEKKKNEWKETLIIEVFFAVLNVVIELTNTKYK